MAETLLQMITRHEGVRHKPYKDTTGHLTIGIGRNLAANGVSDDEIKLMLRNDVHRTIRALETAIPEWHVRLMSGNGAQHMARENVIISMAFNLGAAGVAGFKKMWAAIDREDFDAAAREMLDSKWARQVGHRAQELAQIMRTGKMP